MRFLTIVISIIALFISSVALILGLFKIFNPDAPINSYAINWSVIIAVIGTTILIAAVGVARKRSA